MVDENDFIEELNEENNNASLTIVVNEKINAPGNSFYMNFVIIIGIALILGILRIKKKVISTF